MTNKELIRKARCNPKELLDGFEQMIRIVAKQSKQIEYMKNCENCEIYRRKNSPDISLTESNSWREQFCNICVNHIQSELKRN